jgi:hypothetical protein
MTIIINTSGLEIYKAILMTFSTIAGIAIPIVLHYAAQQIRRDQDRVAREMNALRDREAKEANTLRAMQDLEVKVSEILARKTELDNQYGKLINNDLIQNICARTRTWRPMYSCY